MLHLADEGQRSTRQAAFPGRFVSKIMLCRLLEKNRPGNEANDNYESALNRNLNFERRQLT